MAYKPHLACDTDLSKLIYPVAVMVKIDGNRLVIQQGKATGRSLKPYKNKKLTEYYSKEEFSGLEGELAYGDITSESLCRDTTSVVNTIKSGIVPTLHCFDYVTEETKDLGFAQRHAIMVEKLFGMWQEDMSLNCAYVPYYLCDNEAEVLQHYEDNLALGYEGIIIRSLDGKHKDGRCTANEATFTRMKPSHDAEAIVLRLEEAQENLNEAKVNELGRTERSSHQENKVGKGMCGMLVCKDLVSGQEINVGAGKMTHEERTMYWENPEKIVGMMIKYRSMSVGVKDKPRFPRFIGFRVAEDIGE